MGHLSQVAAEQLLLIQKVAKMSLLTMSKLQDTVAKMSLANSLLRQEVEKLKMDVKYLEHGKDNS